MSGFNPLKEVINAIPIPEGRLTEVLRVEGMSKIYQQKHHTVNALKNIHCTIYQGEMVAIMGTSGSGKSTLLNMISAIDEPTDGALFLFGKEAQAIYQEPKASQFRKENIGFIFQSFHLLKDLTVEDNIALPPLILNDIPSKEIKVRVQHMMETLNIAAGQSIDHMSFLVDRSNASPLRERLLPILLFYWQMSQRGGLWMFIQQMKF